MDSDAKRKIDRSVLWANNSHCISPLVRALGGEIDPKTGTIDVKRPGPLDNYLKRNGEQTITERQFIDSHLFLGFVDSIKGKGCNFNSYVEELGEDYIAGYNAGEAMVQGYKIYDN